ncbi:hypothetical protein AB0N05_08460 [Nocardia sp. NPDC051030]|uniref:hypothetical protein n=1 Tax=Nocardia sp. NPDC051030 TaxID=3155162 RepID=UPI003423DA4F
MIFTDTVVLQEDQTMATGGPSSRSRGLDLEAVHWHIVREDQHRVGVATRASAVLSTNALVIAGTALAASVRGTQRPNPLVISSTLATLVFVAASVFLASTALVTPQRRKWVPRWDGIDSDSSMVYSYPYYDYRWSSFEEFRKSITDQSPEQQLRGAILELWKATFVDQYRYRKLRLSTRCLIGSIGFLLFTVGLTAVVY